MKMQPTQASKRRRAISDPGALASNRQRFGTQTMGAPVGHDAGTEDVLQRRTLRTSSSVAATIVMQMQPTFAARRVRSCSDPGSLEFGAEDMKSHPAEVIVRTPIDWPIVPRQEGIPSGFCRRSQSTSALLDTSASRCTPATTILLNQTDRPCNCEQPASDQSKDSGEALAKMTQRSSPGPSRIQRPTQGEVLSDREDAFAASPMETQSAVSSADLGVLLDTQEATTSDRGSTIEMTVEVSPVEPPGEDSTQPSSQQDTTSAGANSLGGILSTDTCVPPIPLKLPRIQKENYFTQFEGLVPAPEFDDFRSTLSRERNFTATMWRVISGRFVSSAWPTSWGYVESTAVTVLLIEDADIRCFLDLQRRFYIDPRFMVDYVGCQSPVASFGGRWWRLARQHRYHQSESGFDVKPSWYTMNVQSCGEHLWHDSQSSTRSAREHTSDLSDDRRPWWQEPRRNVQSDRNCPERSFQTVVACCCLSPRLRKSGLKFVLKMKSLTHADRQVLSSLSRALHCSSELSVRSISSWTLTIG